MSKINTHCQVREYPDDGKEYQTLNVRNHWNRREMVVFEIGGKSYTFLANDVKQAIENAVNSH